MQELRRQEALPNQLHSRETTLQEQYKKQEDTPGADKHSDHNHLVAEVQTRLKSIKNLGIRNQNGIWKNQEQEK